MTVPSLLTQSRSTDAATTRPTIVNREPSHCLVHSTLHSKWLRHSPIRGGLTAFDGIAVRPAISSSLMPLGKLSAVTWTFSSTARSNGTILTTNSAVDWTFCEVCLPASIVNSKQVGTWL